MSHRQHHDPVQVVNDRHADGLLAIARAFAGHPDATSARAERIDPSGIDLVLVTPGGPETARVEFTGPVAADNPNGARAAFKELARRARAAIAPEGDEPGAS